MEQLKTNQINLLTLFVWQLHTSEHMIDPTTDLTKPPSANASDYTIAQTTKLTKMSLGLQKTYFCKLIFFLQFFNKHSTLHLTVCVFCK